MQYEKCSIDNKSVTRSLHESLFGNAFMNIAPLSIKPDDVEPGQVLRIHLADIVVCARETIKFVTADD